METLLDVDRAEAHADLMRDPSLGSVSILKADLRACVNAADQYLSDNQAAMNLALPLPGRTLLTPAQKALVYIYAIQRRYLRRA